MERADVSECHRRKAETPVISKGRHFEAWLIVQAVVWYLRYPLSYRDLEEMVRERGPSLGQNLRYSYRASDKPGTWDGFRLPHI